jgi:hypothetical protein
MYFSGLNDIPYEKLKKHQNVPDWIINAYNDKHFDPKKLTAIQQNTLFIIDMFNN